MRLVSLSFIAPFTFKDKEVPMAFIIPRDGALQALAELLNASNGEDWEIGLYNSAVTPAETDTAATYTSRETAFSGYVRKTLTRGVGSGKWSTPALAAPSGSPPWTSRGQVARSAFAAQTWTCGATGDVIHGWFVLGKTSGKLILTGTFPSPRTLASSDTLAVTPSLEW